MYAIRSYYADGCYLVINYMRNQAAAEETLRQVRVVGGDGEICGFDVRDRESVETAIGALADRLGGFDILVNNAG